MIPRIIILLSLLFIQINAKAQYQSLTLQPQKIQKKPYKLNVEESTANFEPSNVGIIGMKYLHKPGSMSTVIEIYPSTPAQKAGIQIGDRLLEVNGVSIIPYNSDQVFAMIAGLPGTPINLKFMRCNYYGNDCRTFATQLIRMDMNELNSDRIYRIYKYGS
jgi:C-terminal processing protease CtpA/Prc